MIEAGRSARMGRAHDWSAGLRQGAFPLLCAVFLLSGFSALVYQTAWQRMLGLFAGSDAVAATLVVGAFLFGLGVGSLIGALIADRLSTRGSIQGFGLCEIGIGLCALASNYVLNDFLFHVVVPLEPSPTMVALTVVAALFLPTLLMGMSLPLLARAAVSQIETASARIGLLYGINTTGAAIGAGLSGFVLIGHIGYLGTVILGAVINLAVGATAILLGAGMRGEPLTLPVAARRDPAKAGQRRVLLGWSAAVFVSGFLIISLEIVWFRLVGAMMQSTAYSFALVLALFLIADAAGVVWGSRIVGRIASPRRVFMVQQAGMALLALGAILLVYHGHRWLGLAHLYILGDGYHRLGSLGGEAQLLAWGLLGVACIMPSAFLLGLSFPVAQKAVQQDLGEVGRRVGIIQLANILGNTAGALVTGLVLLHVIGTAGTLLLVGLAGLGFALMLAVERHQPWTIATAGALAAVLLLMPGNRALWAGMHGSQADHAMVREDRTGVAVVFDLPDQSIPGAQVLYVGGRWQSRMNPYSPVQGALGLLAAQVHPDPRSILVIGYGGGGSVWAASSNPATERLHVVEIVEPVVGVIHDYAEAKAGSVPNALLDPRVDMTIADGRHQLLISLEEYDVIVAEAIVPESAHSGLLFSVEFFHELREHLKPGGIVVEWAPTQRTVNTFRHAFPYVTRTGNALIGSLEPVEFSLERFEQAMRTTAHPQMVAGGWTPDDVLAWLAKSPVETWTPADPPAEEDINTDLFPKDEYFLNNGRRW